jgi:hypothetical protein
MKTRLLFTFAIVWVVLSLMGCTCYHPIEPYEEDIRTVSKSWNDKTDETSSTLLSQIRNEPFGYYLFKRIKGEATNTTRSLGTRASDLNLSILKPLLQELTGGEDLARKNKKILTDLYRDEYHQIRMKRERNTQVVRENDKVPSNLRALCLSGGGVRSASFNLGVLQALHKLEILTDMDYLSSVSGGTYISGWYMSHWDQIGGDNALFNPAGPQMRNILEEGNYLSSSHASKNYTDLGMSFLMHMSTVPFHWVFNVVLDFDWNIDFPYLFHPMRTKYRDGLKRAYLEESDLVPRKDYSSHLRKKSVLPKNLYLADLKPENILDQTSETLRPFWIANAGIGLRDDQTLFKNQFGDVFEMTPLRCGSDAIGYVRSDKSIPWTGLPYVLGMSGAAVSMNEIRFPGTTRLLIGAMNLDLGYFIDSWHPNWNYGNVCYEPGDRFCQDRLNRLRANFKWVLGMIEPLNLIFASQGSETGHDRTLKAKRYFISDGGHFENLGALSAIRRGCRFVIISDGSYDPFVITPRETVESVYDKEKRNAQANSEMKQLSLRLKNELNADLEIRLNIEEQIKHSVTTGTVRFFRALREDPEKNEIVNVLYIKPLYELEKDAEGYLHLESYKASQKGGQFPQETTADQYFSEKQLSAYRDLGYRTVMNNRKMFEDMQKEWGKEIGRKESTQ